MRRRLLFTGVYVVSYTLASVVLVAAATGMGEASIFPLVLLSSPLGVISPFGLFFPLPGLILGVLLLFRRRRAAGFWPLLHYVGVPISMWQQSLGVENQLEQLHRTPGATLALAIFYLLGNIFAWMVILRRDSLPVVVEA